MKNLSEGNIYKNYLLFAIPMVLSGLLSQGYSTIDTIIAGKYLGTDGLAAIGATAPFITFFSAIFWGFWNGLAVYTAMLFGAEQYARIKNELFNHLLTLSGVILGLSILIVCFREKIYQILHIDPTIQRDANIYFVIYLLGIVFIILNNSGVYLMNAFGSGMFPFIMSLLSAVLNISGNLFSVAVLKIGIAGIALSSVLSALIVDFCYYIKLKACYAAFGVKEQKVHFSPKILLSAYRYCIPIMFQQSVMYVATLVLSPMINGIGKAASAGYTVIIRIYDINSSIYQNSAKTVANYTAQSIGGNKLNQLKKGLGVGLLQGLLFLLPVLLICVVFPKQICALFFDDAASVQAVSYSVVFLRYYLPFIVINLVANLLHAYFRGCGAMFPLFFATLLGSVSRIAFSWFFIPIYGMSGMYLGWVISWTVDALFGCIYYLCGKWKKNIPVFSNAEAE